MLGFSFPTMKQVKHRWFFPHLLLSPRALRNSMGRRPRLIIPKRAHNSRQINLTEDFWNPFLVAVVFCVLIVSQKPLNFTMSQKWRWAANDIGMHLQLVTDIFGAPIEPPQSLEARNRLRMEMPLNKLHTNVNFSMKVFSSVSATGRADMGWSATPSVDLQDADTLGISAVHLITRWLVVSNIFYFHSYFGKIPILTNIFQRGWNRQLEHHVYLWRGFANSKDFDKLCKS